VADNWVKTEGLTYQERNSLLSDLGFASYGDYLQSELWQKVRLAAKTLHGKRKCSLCAKKKRLEAHHYAYTAANLSGVSPEHIFFICSKCHRKVEFTRRSRRKRPLHEAQSVFHQMMKKSMKKKGHRAGWCPVCTRNRSYQGGACPPCRRRQDRALTESSATAARPGRLPDSKSPIDGSEGGPAPPGASDGDESGSSLGC